MDDGHFGYIQKFQKKTHYPKIQFFFFPSIFSCSSKIEDQPQEVLAKSGYKTNFKIKKNPRILLNVGKHQNLLLLAKDDNFKRKKKVKNLPKSSKNLDDFKTFFLFKMLQFFWENFPKSSLDHITWDLMK